MAHGVIAAILAGGRGTRMGGVAKGRLEVAGRSILSRQLDVILPHVDRVVVVANDPMAYGGFGVPVVPDRAGPGCGPLAGLETALASLSGSEAAALCFAADMPCLTATLVQLLRDEAPAALVVAPEVDGTPEPLCARYGRACLPRVSKAREEGRFKLLDLLRELGGVRIGADRLRALGLDPRFATNLNTPADLARLEADFDRA
ncbi:MAG: molybdenum cofactor guanylyltransferase [Myxococcales bacterium]|nr:molybdenum cofactor guanylyltransferase [Myxococcales bacterium]